MKLATAKKKLRAFRVSLITGLIFLILCIGTTVASALLEASAYETFTTISPSTQTEIKRETYQRAIRMSPEKCDAYILLLDAYNEDGLFSKEESEEFLSIYNSNHTSIGKKDDQYPELHYRAGFLYVNGYDASTTTRLRMALPFLEEALATQSDDASYALAIQCYCRIGAYYRDYIWDAASTVREVSSTEVAALVADIQQTLVAFESDSSSDAIFNRLGFCVAVCNLFYDQRDILAATVPKETVDAVLDQIYDGLPNEQLLQKEQTRTLLQTLKDNESSYRSMLDRAYGRKGDP